MSLTDTTCRTETVTEGQKELADGRGLYLVVGTRTKAWVLRFKQDGKSRRANLGYYAPGQEGHLSLSDARLEAALFKKALKQGLVPKATQKTAPKHKGMTVSEAFALYMREKWGAGERDHSDKRIRARWAIYESNFEQRIGHQPLTALTKAEIKGLYRAKHEAMKARGKTGRGIGNIQRTFAAFLNWCVKNDDMTGLRANPAHTIELLDAGGERDRWLNRQECALVLRAIRAVGGEFARPLELLMRAGCRKSDIFDLEPSRVMNDEELGRHLLIPDTKNGQDLVVPLVPAMDALVPEAGVWSCSGESTTRVKNRIDAEVARLNGGKRIPDWRLHDLRTTCGSHLDTFGIDDRVIEKILCHKEPNKAKRTYRRYGFYAEKKAALQRWNDLLDAVVAKVEPEELAA